MPITSIGFTLDDLRQDLGAFARQCTLDAIAEIMPTEIAAGFDADAIIITDGVTNKDFSQVKPYGRVEFARRARLADAVLWARDKLIAISPVGPAEGGHYRDDHIVLVDGKQVTGDLRAALINLPAGSRVILTNPRIYARKIEGAQESTRTGRKKRKALSSQAKNGVYQVVTRQILQQFGRVLFADFKYVQLNTGARVWGDQGGRYRKNGTRGVVKRVQRNQVYPSIQLYIKPGMTADAVLN